MKLTSVSLTSEADDTERRIPDWQAADSSRCPATHDSRSIRFGTSNWPQRRTWGTIQPVASIAFDTLKFSDRLKEAGVPPALAEAEARAMAEALSASDIATKSDLLELKVDIIKWMVGLALAQVGLLVGILVKLL